MKKATATRLANLRALYRHGWPRNADNRRVFWLKPYGSVHSAFSKGRGFWMHLESDVRVAFGRDYQACLRALVRILESGAEAIEMEGI